MLFSSSFRQSIQSIIKDGQEQTCVMTQRNNDKPKRKCFTRKLRGSRKQRKKTKRRRKRRKRRRRRRKRKKRTRRRR